MKGGRHPNGIAVGTGSDAYSVSYISVSISAWVPAE